jgi:hypothetical protein
MADQRPDVPATETSYSDPIYDRLEQFSHGLQRRWPLVLLLFVVAVVTGLVVQGYRQSSPEAESARLFMEASGDRAALVELVANEEQVSGLYRARGFMELVQLDIDDQEFDQAIEHADQGLAIAQQVGEDSLIASLRLSLAAAQRAADKPEDALATLAAVERAAVDLPMHRFEAQLAQARLLDALASEGADQAEQDEWLQQALVILEPLRLESGSGHGRLIDAARFLYFDIIRRYPRLDPNAEMVEEMAPVASQPVTTADHADAAPEPADDATTEADSAATE